MTIEQNVEVISKSNWKDRLAALFKLNHKKGTNYEWPEVGKRNSGAGIGIFRDVTGKSLDDRFRDDLL